MHRLFSTQLEMQTISLNRREYIDIFMGLIFLGSPCKCDLKIKKKNAGIENNVVKGENAGYLSLLFPQSFQKASLIGDCVAES